MPLKAYMAPGFLGDDEHRIHVNVGCVGSYHSIQGRTTSGQEGTEEGARYEAELLTTSHFPSVNRGDSGAVFDTGHEVRKIPNIAVAVGVHEYQEALLNCARVKLEAGGDGRGDLFSHVVLKGPSGLTELVEGDSGVDTCPSGAVGVDDGSSSFELTICYELGDFAKGRTGELDHISRDVVLIHQGGLGGQLEENGILLEGDRYVGVVDRSGIRNGPLGDLEVNCGDLRHTVRASVIGVKPTEYQGVGFIERLLFLHTERSENHGWLGMLQHLQFCPDKVPRRDQAIGLSTHYFLLHMSLA